MTSFKKKDLATSITTFTFLIISITGVMMFFHVLDQYTKEMHEILGLAFVLFALFHIFFNWKSMKNYFKKKSFLLSAILTLVITVGFISNVGNKGGEHPSKMVISAVFNAPLNDAITILGKDVQLVNQKLEKSGILLEDANSILEISKKNHTSPYKIVQIISK
ncbi:DUF4405 domain-containing protein [Sulfurospirillum arcachonense]|uniref:DUF4405 domain-containing protein n=1 Tax=Sulfurospirillum arcachonense TaxID=57666 RepID=UPI000469DE64|nr:DUF4405 domain-containing protein [Sulfurospirillum arcachonense]